jgi:hypothetical protein
MSTSRATTTVKRWTKDGGEIERKLYAESSLDQARQVFTSIGRGSG